MSVNFVRLSVFRFQFPVSSVSVSVSVAVAVAQLMCLFLFLVPFWVSLAAAIKIESIMILTLPAALSVHIN